MTEIKWRPISELKSSGFSGRMLCLMDRKADDGDLELAVIGYSYKGELRIVDNVFTYDMRRNVLYWCPMGEIEDESVPASFHEEIKATTLECSFKIKAYFSFISSENVTLQEKMAAFGITVLKAGEYGRDIVGTVTVGQLDKLGEFFERYGITVIIIKSLPRGRK